MGVNILNSSSLSHSPPFHILLSLSLLSASEVVSGLISSLTHKNKKDWKKEDEKEGKRGREKERRTLLLKSVVFGSRVRRNLITIEVVARLDSISLFSIFFFFLPSFFSLLPCSLRKSFNSHQYQQYFTFPSLCSIFLFFSPCLSLLLLPLPPFSLFY